MKEQEKKYPSKTEIKLSLIHIQMCIRDRGVETQTRKLMEVCRMRKTPVIIFVNKMDREGKDPFDLLDELEEELMIQVRPCLLYTSRCV